MNRRRRPRRYRTAGYNRKMQMHFVPVIVIICLSICAGYFAAKYVIYPFLGYEPTELQFFKQQKKEPADTDAAKELDNESLEAMAETEKPTESETASETKKTDETKSSETRPSEQTKIIEDEVEVKEVAGYALQFGSYSTKAAAQKTLKQLKSSGVTAEIKEIDGQYKIIGRLFDTKEKAKEALNQLDDSVAAFVAEIEK